MNFLSVRLSQESCIEILQENAEAARSRRREIVTDLLRSYGAVVKDLGIRDRQGIGRWGNNRAENSNQRFRRREWAMLSFRGMRTLQKFITVPASVHNLFNTERHLHS